jgi:hypothetical protein
MRSSRDCAGDGLFGDGTEVPHRQVIEGKVVEQIFQPDAASTV